jgi:hypothetical protein
MMFAIFFQRVRMYVSLIQQYGLKRVLIAVREFHRRQESTADNVLPTLAFYRYQVFKC